MNELRSLRVNVRGALLLVVGFLAAVAVMRDWTPTTAQTAPTRIAIVDTETVMLRSKLGKAMTAELQKIQQDGQREYNAAPNAANRDQIKQAIQQRYNAKRDQMIDAANAKIMPVIQAIGKELKAAAIFRKFESGLVYTDDTLDITNSVIQRVDAATP